MTETHFADGTHMAVRERDDGMTLLGLHLDGQQVSRVLIVPALLRIGAAVVRMDGIGGVETATEFRNRGYSRRTMEEAIARMRAGEAAISTLYGIQDYYPKFGYATAGPGFAVRLALEADDRAAPLPPGWHVRPFVAADLPAVQRLYHQVTRHATAAFVRHETDDASPEQARLTDAAVMTIGGRAWRRLARVAEGTGEDACRVLLDARGRLAGYAWVARESWWIDYQYRADPTSFHLGEAMVADPEAADAMVLACRRWALEWERGKRAIEITVPPDHPLSSAMAYAGATLLARHTRDGEFMVRVLDVARLLRQLQPELTRRLRVARLPTPRVLTIRTEIGEASLAFSPDGVEVTTNGGGAVVELPQATLGRLALGGFLPADLLARLPTPIESDLADLVATLFPQRAPHVYPIDHF